MGNATWLLPTVGSILIAAVVAAVGWLIRRWVAGLETKVDAQATLIGGQFDEVQAITLDLDAKVDDVRERVAGIEGALGLPARGPRRGEERRRRSPAQRQQGRRRSDRGH